MAHRFVALFSVAVILLLAAFAQDSAVLHPAQAAEDSPVTRTSVEQVSNTPVRIGDDWVGTITWRSATESGENFERFTIVWTDTDPFSNAGTWVETYAKRWTNPCPPDSAGSDTAFGGGISVGVGLMESTGSFAIDSTDLNFRLALHDYYYNASVYPVYGTTCDGQSYAISQTGNTYADFDVPPVPLPYALIPSLVGTFSEQFPILGGSYTVTADYNLTKCILDPCPLIDSDNDGVLDINDGCPGTPAGTTVDARGCATILDSDGDGVPDTGDDCPGTPAGTTVDARGCPAIDSDGDGTPDSADLCINVPGLPQFQGCPDTDGDGVPDSGDHCPGTPTGTTVDAEGCGRFCLTDPGQDPVFCYAPQVRLHPDENNFPIGTDEFVVHSKLMWAHDWGCPDEQSAGYGAIDPYRLSGRTSAYSARQSKNSSCNSKGDYYYSNELTRPTTKNKYKPNGLATNEGFYLDLDDDFHEGVLPVGGIYGKVHTPLTYSFVSGKYITYWFMYGLNPGAPGAGSVVDVHEGEWERITVLLLPNNTAYGVQYYQHLCTPEFVPWTEMTDATTANGGVVLDTHPIVYSALGSHASYRKPVDIHSGQGGCSLFGIPKVQGVGDKTEDGGATWDTWERLRRDRDSSWYGFGGAWGKNASHKDANFDGINVTGPLGPPCQDPTSVAVLPQCDP